jgi:glutamate N-acetyltransferase/amino-acid N-acetyltransferase
MKIIEDGTVTSPSGFSAAAVSCGFKESGGLDLAMIYSHTGCSAAGMFTRNRVLAAPVIVDKDTLAANSDNLRAIVANAGVANACTGPKGLAAARITQTLTAKALDCLSDQVLVLSTGVIGIPLDIEKMAEGIPLAAKQLSPEAGQAVARAIMTTDTRPKHLAVRVPLPDGEVTIGGMAKGSGMIHPDMATMLAVLTTDAGVSPESLRQVLSSAVGRTFNRISIDGDTSTNDTVLILSNGASGRRVEDHASLTKFAEGVESACAELARKIVRDGEGASKFVTIRVTGTPDEAAAVRIGRTIATSPLVKTAFAGGDPNWGRILAAAGRAGVEFDPEQVRLWVAPETGTELAVVDHGAPTEVNAADMAAIFRQQSFRVHLDLGMGLGEATVWTCDMTREYVSINADYHT